MKKYYTKQFIILLALLFLVALSYFLLKNIIDSLWVIILIIVIGATIMSVILDKSMKVSLSNQEEVNIAKINLLVGPLGLLVVFIFFKLLFTETASFDSDSVITALAIMFGALLGAFIRLKIVKNKQAE